MGTRIQPSNISPVEDAPSLLQYVEKEGYGGFIESLTPEQVKYWVIGSFKAGWDMSSVINTFKEFFERIEILDIVRSETLSLPIAELHVPRIGECKARYKQTEDMSSEYSINVNVFGFGGGINKKINYGEIDEIETSMKCYRLSVPVTIEWQKCISKSWMLSDPEPISDEKNTFFRCNVLDIGKNFDLIELDANSDGCKQNIIDTPDEELKRVYRGIDKLYYGAGSPDETLYIKDEDIYRINVPEGVIRNKTLSIEKDKRAEISLQTQIAGFKIGPSAIVNNLRKTEYHYTLTGPHNYLAWLVGGHSRGMGYCWNWL